MTELETVFALAEEWGEWQREPTFPLSPDHCINGTRVAILALTALGVKAKPVSVGFLLFNRYAVPLFKAKVPVEDWPEFAWSIGRLPALDDDGETFNKWNGHLMCEGDGWTLDISAMQFNRPGRIRIDNPRVIPMNLPPAGTRADFTDDHENLLIVERWPQNNSWRHSKGWQRLPNYEVSELLRRLDRKETP